MTKPTHIFLRTAAVSGVAGALLVTGFTQASSAATTSSAQSAAMQHVTINVAIAYPAPSKAALAAFTKIDRHQRQLFLHPVGQPADQDRRRRRGAHLLCRRHRRRLVQGGRVLRRRNGSCRSTSTSTWRRCRPSTHRSTRLSATASSSACPATPRCSSPTSTPRISPKPGSPRCRPPSPQYQADLKQVQSKGVVAHPLDIPFAAAEGLSTYWYEMTAAFGGGVLSSSYTAGVHFALLPRLQGDDLDGGRLQGRPGAQGQPRPGRLPGLQRRPGRKPYGQRLFGLFG